MPGKHNAGGCGCCGNPSSCWSCDHPVSLEASAGAGTCCSSFDATLVFPSDAVLSSNLCEYAWTLTKPYQLDLGIGDTPGTSGACVSNYCPIAIAANSGAGDAEFVCEIETYTTSSPSCKTLSFVLSTVRYEVHIRDVAGSPTITVTLEHSYVERTNTKGGSGVCQQNNALREWLAVDTYESVIDCNDATTVLTHISRTITDPDGAGTSSPIVWGWSSEKSYTVCSAPTITLNLV